MPKCIWCIFLSGWLGLLVLRTRLFAGDVEGMVKILYPRRKCAGIDSVMLVKIWI